MTRPPLHVHMLPALVAESDLAGSTVIVVDLLRASTTICQALASGASEVVPFVEVADALAAARNVDRSTIVLGGERSGRIIDGFDLGNSPAEYTPAAVAGRRVLFTTTNGTRALEHANAAQRVVIGAMVNLSAVVASVKDCPRVDVLCAGTGGLETREDMLAAGAIVHRLCLPESGAWQLGDDAEAARRAWQALLSAAQVAGHSPSDELALELRDTPGGRNLLAIGMDADLVVCAQIDALNIVPEFGHDSGRIYLP